MKTHGIAMRLGVALIAVAASGCGLAPRPVAGPQASIRTTTVQLHGKALELYLAAPASPAHGDVLVVYASGDGGWFGAAVDMFKKIAAEGYYAVGFSSKSLLHIERPRGALVDVRELAAEYARITRAASSALGLDDRVSVVLTGWSRGAAFAVLVASEPAAARRSIAGVVAIGMAAGENLRLDEADDEGDGDPDDSHTGPAPFEPYARIAQLGDRPCAVIQATHDNYLPASRARALFGADTPSRHFYSIEANNHRFSGGRAAFSAALSDALRFVAGAVHTADAERTPNAER